MCVCVFVCARTNTPVVLSCTTDLFYTTLAHAHMCPLSRLRHKQLWRCKVLKNSTILGKVVQLSYGRNSLSWGSVVLLVH